MHFIKFFTISALICFSATMATAQTSTAATATPVATKSVETEKTIKVKVKGVGCSRDLKAIATSVADLEGVNLCETLKKGATTTFSVTFNPAVATEKMIYSAVENTPGCSNQTARPYKVKL